MRKRSFIFISILVVGVLGLLAWALRTPPEPLFQGHTARYWMNSIEDGTDPPGQAARLWEKLGPQSMPMLVRALQIRSGPLTKCYSLVWPHLPDGLRKRFRQPAENPKGLRGHAALVAAYLPGDTRLMVPALVGALEDEDWGVRMNTAAALGTIWKSHEEIFPVLVKALRNREPYVRANIIASFGFARSPAEVLPLLMKSLHDPAALVRVRAVHSLHQLDPETAAKMNLVPILVECTADPEWRARITAIQTLGRFGTNAQPAIPVLRQALTDRSTGIAETASNSLRQIESEVAGKPPAGSAAR